MGDLRKVGRMGLRSLALALLLSASSVLIGLFVAGTIQPGKRLDPAVAATMEKLHGDEAKQRAAAAPTLETAKAPLMTVVQSFVPSNVFSSMSQDPPDMLGLMAFSLFFGVLLTMTMLLITSMAVVREKEIGTSFGFAAAYALAGDAEQAVRVLGQLPILRRALLRRPSAIHHKISARHIR